MSLLTLLILLEIDIKAIIHNYKTLQAMLPRSTCGAVLKADAYGLGMKEIAPALSQEGCQHFFVAHLEEGLFLRAQLKEPSIYVLSGLLPGAEDLFVENALTPVLNDFGMVENWAKEAQRQGRKLPCVLHIDTGMRRNGFDRGDVEKLFKALSVLESLDVKFVMSHLVSSHASDDPLNEQQRDLFESFLKRLPQAKASLADTGGIYLDATFHYDMARPGKGLFGLYTPPAHTPPLVGCLKVLGRILQIRTAHKGESVGYGASYSLTRDSKLATLGIGFADGYDRRLSNNAFVEIQGFKAPVVGRISMDYTVVDVTDIPESLYYVGGWAELINETLTLDVLAQASGTISRELSTRFGARLYRMYR
ncbi:MAG: alanine racemase [Proteobacteria bacterium]|nr:alanine racemase [Pseudomonadota bacterium]